MKIHDCEQGSVEWFKIRAGKVTASEIDALISPEFEIRKGKGVQTYAYQKAGEAFHAMKCPNSPVVSGYSSFAMEQGRELEDEARRIVAFENEAAGFGRLRDAGFCEHDDGRCGCSPDALIGDDGGLELKCPEITNHTRYFYEKILPKEYAAQVHMSLYVTGRPWWRFVSYRRKFPRFTLTVHRDETICATIAEALAGFYAKYDKVMEALRA